MTISSSINLIPLLLLVAAYCFYVSIRAIKQGKVHTKKDRKPVTYYRKTNPFEFWLSTGVALFVAIASTVFFVYILTN